MLLSSQKKIYKKTTTPHVISQLMGDGWGAGTGARAAERGRGGMGRARAGARGRGWARRARGSTRAGRDWAGRARARDNVDGAGLGARRREHAGEAGRGARARGNTQVGQGGRARRTIPTPPHRGRSATHQSASTSDHHPRAPSICPCAAHSAWGVGVAEDIGVPPCPAHAD